MSVDEMVAKVDELDRDELAQLRAAVEQAQARLDETAEERWQRGDEALARLMQGVGKSGGKCLSEGIDEALYGSGR